MTDLKDRFQTIAAVYAVFRDGDNVLLLRRFNTGYLDGNYSLPAGHIDGGEPATAALVREAREEVGVTLDSSQLALVHTMHRLSTTPEPHERIDLYFEVENWDGEPANMEPQKCDELRWVSTDQLPENMVPEVRLALESIADGKIYSEYNFPA